MENGPQWTLKLYHACLEDAGHKEYDRLLNHDPKFSFDFEISP